MVAYITGDGLKTLDAVRGTFEVDRDRAVDRRVRRRLRAGRGDGLMAVTVKLPTQLRDAAGGAAPSVASTAARWGRRSRRSTPSTASCAAASSDDGGGLRRFVNVYIGGEDIRFLDGLDTPVSDGDELTILPAVAGG